MTATGRDHEARASPYRRIRRRDVAGPSAGAGRATPGRLGWLGRVRVWSARVLDPAPLPGDAGWCERHGPAAGIAAVYALVAGVYIVVSSSVVGSPGTEIAKGLAFVGVTALILGVVLDDHRRRTAAAGRRMRELIEATGDVVYRFRRWPTMGVDYVSEHIVEWTGLTARDHYANPDIGFHLVHPDDRARLRELVARGSSGGPVLLRWVAPDGRVLHTEHDFHDVRDRRGRIVALDGRVKNVTEPRRDRAENELSAAILRWLADETIAPDAVLGRACGEIVRLMGVETAWVSAPLADGSVRMERAAGDTAWMTDVAIRWDDGPLSMGPTGRAIRDREPVMMRPTDPGFAAWRQRARTAGITAALAVPILWRGQVVAALTVCSRFGDPFDAANIERFDRIGRLLALAMPHRPVDDAPDRRRPVRAAAGASHFDVASAIEDDRVDVWWQPQVAADGRIVALEALLRLRDPDGGIVLPDAVLPYAEEHGMMASLGQAVRRRAVRHAAPWLAAGLERICVNVSVAELLAPGFVGELEDLVDLDGLRPQQIELELVETAPLRANGVRTLDRLVSRGFRVAVDDYGSGWASLGHLAQIPATVLKIDRVFVRDVVTSERSRALVASTFELGHVLGLETVAEGVETVDQAELLCAMGCDLLQGYLFARPLDREATDALLRGVGTDHWPTLAEPEPSVAPR